MKETMDYPGISLFCWLPDLGLVPPEQHQAKIRQDSRLSGFYMFFNFFLFPLEGFNAFRSSAPGQERFSRSLFSPGGTLGPKTYL